jgi:hypothetical protein
MWNAYSDALIPYPARVIMPDSDMIKRMLIAQRVAIQSGTPWCPLRALSALGIIYGVKGGPKCPKVSAWTHGAWAHVRGEPWGPSHAREAQSLLWDETVRHAHLITHEPELEPDPNGSILAASRIVIRTANDRFNDPQATVARGLGHSIHVVTWHRTHGRPFARWIAERSASRRWAPGDGNEWLTLASAQNVTDATRFLRLLCNALPGRARWRPNAQRVAHKCHLCDTQPVQLVWRSPSPPDAPTHDEGVAWCSACISPDLARHSWAELPDDMIPSGLRDRAAQCGRTQGRTWFDTRPSYFGACPLCGRGEAGAEHIWQWCTAAVLTWQEHGDGTHWREALLGHASDKERLVVVASQILFLYTALVGRSSLTAENAARRIGKAIRAITRTDDGHLGNNEDANVEHCPIDLHTWTEHSECGRCARGDPNLCRAALRRSQDTSRPGSNGTPEHSLPRPVANTDVNVGRIMATVYANGTPARWMVASATWWPQPRATQERLANCEWLTRRCRHCGRHEANLYARGHIERGGELTVPRSLAPVAGSALVPYEVFFDGGTSTRGNQHSAGAGALVWQIFSNGPPICIARAIMAIPENCNATLAEAHACGMALRLLSSLAREHWETHGTVLRACVLGDCIPVVRYAAAQARFRAANLRGPIDRGLEQVADIGWHITWQAVNRRHNQQAHSLARSGVNWANHIARRGTNEQRTHMEWRSIPSNVCPEIVLPAWP